MYQPIFEITEEIEAHFDSTLSVKAEATVEAISLSKSISSATQQQRVELAKASGWGTLTDIWVKSNHQGNTWQHRCYEKLSKLLTPEEIQSAKSATATAYQTSFEVIRAMWDLLAEVGFTGGSILEPACNTLSFMGCQPEAPDDGRIRRHQPDGIAADVERDRPAQHRQEQCQPDVHTASMRSTLRQPRDSTAPRCARSPT